MITYIKGDLFDAPSGSILAHACNCKGVWGSGIAVDFKKNFPVSFEVYKDVCLRHGDKLIGKSLAIHEHGRVIVCLFTSRDYGDRRDSPVQIQSNTKRAINHFGLLNPEYAKHPINMPKINSGRFAVPWEKTVQVLNEFDMNFKVWEL